MSDIGWRIFETGISLFESFVVIHFICAFLNHDFKTVKGKCVFAIGVAWDFIAVMILNKIANFEGIMGALYISVYWIYCLIFLKGSVLKKLYVSFLSNLVLAFSSMIVVSIVSNAMSVNVFEMYDNMTFERLLSMLCVQLLLICVYDILLKYSVKRMMKSEWSLILSVLIISFISMICIHIVLINGKMDHLNAKMLMFSEFGIIILNVVCFYMTYALSRSHAETEELQLKQQQDEYRTNYADNIKSQYEEMRRTRHDMKQSIAVISALYNEGKYSEANQYVNKLSDNLGKLEMCIDVGNDFINAILNTKLSIARERGVTVICSATNNISGIDDIDLCNLLGNMIDNALEATERCKESFIEVSIDSDDDKVLVIISNSIDEPVLVNNSELKSLKSDKGLHGYGVKTIKSIAQKYNGMAKFYEEDKTFYCQALMYK